MNQLRIRTEFTFGETFAPLNLLIKRLAALGATAGGMVDSGTWGHVKWDAACRAAKIAPMFGVSLAVVPELTTEDRPTMWFLARNNVGLQELYHYSSLGQKQMYRGVARLTYDQVREISGDLFKFAGQVTDAQLLKDCGAYLDFDPTSQMLNRRKCQMLAELNPVVVSDNYYSAIEDHATFEIIGKQNRITAQHLLDRDEMQVAIKELTPAQFTRAAANIEEICAQAGAVRLPKAKLIHVEGDLEAMARAGIEHRGMREKGIWTEEYEKRLQHELGMIRSKKFESYFLMVAEMVVYAKTKMLVGPSRGSAAGSLVCYLARITEVDPIPSKLIFERFIDVTRDDLPDIDLDFVDTKRYLVIEFLRERYGADNVAQIGNVSTFQPKSALTTIAKRIGVPPWDIAPVKDSIFERSSGDSRANFALLDTLEQTDPGRALLAKHPAMILAASIEAHASHSGVHAAGILVCNDAIENFCTLTADGIAQLDKKDAEKLNLLKIDALGLRTLGVLEDSGVEVDWYNLKLDDPVVFKVINDRRFAGVFQFEGRALQIVASQMQVLSLEDIGHITALARPGPMASGGTEMYLLRRAGREKFNLPHIAMEPFVRDTFGVVIYQEQVLSVCRQLGQMDWETVTLLRKAISKSLGKEYFDQFKDKFLVGTRNHGIPDEAAIQIWEGINTMGSWAFNLAHSYSYAVVSYWVAWLKAYHPLQFAAATLRNAMNEESAMQLLRELAREKVNYIPFDPELSQENWSVQDDKLIGGFMGLYGIGATKARALIELREENGGRLPEKKREEVLACKKTFGDIFPTETRFGEYYVDPQKFGIRHGTNVIHIGKITGEAQFVYIGQLKRKDLRDHNETARVQRRKGKKRYGPTLFLDLDLADDTGMILTRIECNDFEEIGRTIWDNAVLGSWWLVRGKRHLWGQYDGGFKMIYVDKIMQLQDPLAITIERAA